MYNLSGLLKYSLGFISLLFFCSIVVADEPAIEWQPLYSGIYYTEFHSNTPCLQQGYALRIDLEEPNLFFMTTPDNGPEELETNTQTTGQFLRQNKLKAAVNANFFAPCCSSKSQPVDLLGLAVSNGCLVSSALDKEYKFDESKPLQPGQATMIINHDNHVRFYKYSDTEIDQAVKQVYNAVSGGPMLLSKGNIIECKNDIARHPRTAAGISSDKRFLYLIVIDGRQEGYSDGATLKETAQWLLKIGACEGINLDGGGSTAMVVTHQQGTRLLNRPSGPSQRLVGNNLGIGIRSK